MIYATNIYYYDNKTTLDVEFNLYATNTYYHDNKIILDTEFKIWHINKILSNFIFIYFLNNIII